MYDAKIALFRRHLNDILLSDEMWRPALYEFCLKAARLQQRLRVVTPLHHVLRMPITEL